MSIQKITHSEFSSRLSKLIELNFNGNWAEFSRVTGVQPSSLQGVKKGRPVKSITMQRIFKATGTSSDWLLTGKGSMFAGGNFDSEAKAIGHLNQLLDENGWNIYVVSDRGASYCLVMSQEHEVETARGEKYSYTEVEIIGGAVGGELLKIVASLDTKQATIYTVDTRVEEIERLVGGEVGTHEIMGRGEKDNGLPGRALPVEQKRALLDETFLPDLGGEVVAGAAVAVGGKARGMKNYPEVGAEEVLLAVEQAAVIMKAEGKIVPLDKLGSTVRLVAEIMADGGGENIDLDKIRQIIRLVT